MSSMIYDLNGIPVQIEYRRIKNINLYIRPPAGEVLVTAPKGTPSGRIKKFVDSKEEWIRLHQEKMREQAGKGEAGQPTKGQIEKMKKQVLQYAKKWEPVMGVHASGWTFRWMKTRWGSCTPRTGKIRLNTKLIFCPEECLEYVLVHELCHLIEPSHNQRFQNYMTNFLPDWKIRRKRLRESGV